MASETKKIQLEVGADASGAKKGFQEVSTAAAGMAQSVQKSGKEASKGVDAVGDSAKKLGDTWTREEARFRGSLQKATLDLQTLGKTASQKFEAKLELKGLDATKFQPYIAGLKEAERAREALNAAEASAARTAQGDQLLSGLREQIRLYGKTSEEVMKYRAAQAGVGAEASNLILQLQNMKAATQAKAQADAQAAAEARKLADATRAQATSQQQFLSSLQTRVATQGLDEAGLLRYRAAQLGVSKEADLLIQKLNKTGASAAQTAAALRGVPAQFTDIATSLAAGQNPLTVFLQQGGQLKDMFGGVGPAAKALGGYLLGLINPFTLTAAAVATLGVAFHQGEKETTEYNKALILTGNYLGLTVSQMQGYAKQISAVVGTQGAAAEALTALASSGKVATQSLTEVGTAVVLMNRVLGQSVDEATKVFVQLADEPTKASAKLNESMHYLNLATFERIRALEEQGQKEQAAALAQSTYATETTARLQRVEASASTLERGWRTLADGAKAAWDAMLNVGRQQSVGDALATAQQKLAEAQAQVAKGGPYAALYGAQAAKQQQAVNDLSRKALRESENAAAESEKAKTNAAQIGASGRIRVAAKEAQTNADMREKFKKQTLADYKTLGDAAFKVASEGKTPEQVIADYNEKHKDQKGAATKAFRDDAGTKTLQTLREQEAALKAQLEVNDKLTAADQERAKYIQLFADLKDKKVLTADQKSLLAQRDAILAQLDQNVAIEKQLELKKEQAKLDEKAKRNAEEFKRQIEGINLSIQSGQQSRSEQYDRELEAIGLGQRAREQVAAQRSIRNEFERYQLALNKQAAEKNQLGSDAYKEESAKIKAALNDALAAQQSYFDALKEKRENWVNGATESLSNYIDYVDDAADRARALIDTTLHGITDSLTDAIWEGNLESFKELGDRIGKQIIAGIVEQQITKPIAQWLQGSVTDQDSFVSKMLGGLLSNKTTGEDWLAAIGLGKGSSAANDEIGNLISAKGLGTAAADGSAAAATAAMAASATTATASLAALAAAAASAAASMGASAASGITGIMGSSSGGITGLMGSGSTWGNLLGSFFAEGGFTGPGGKFQPAGIVHAGEGVLSQEDIRALGGVRGFNSLRLALRRGYSDGGFVGTVGAITGASANQSVYGGDNYNFNFSERVDRRTAGQLANAVSLRQRQGRRYG